MFCLNKKKTVTYRFCISYLKKPSFSSFSIKVLQHCPVSQYFAAPSISAETNQPGHLTLTIASFKEEAVLSYYKR